MAWGERAWSLQYHVELTETTIPDWGAIPEYEKSLIETFGETGLADLQTAAAQHMARFNDDSRRLFDNFMAVARAALPQPHVA